MALGRNGSRHFASHQISRYGYIGKIVACDRLLAAIHILLLAYFLRDPHQVAVTTASGDLHLAAASGDLHPAGAKPCRSKRSHYLDCRIWQRKEK